MSIQQRLSRVRSVFLAPSCADELILARRAAIVLQLITCNFFLSLLCKQIMWSQYAFFRDNGATVFYALARVAGFEITHAPCSRILLASLFVPRLGLWQLEARSAGSPIGITALGWFAWHGGGCRQGLSECKC